MVKTRRSAKKQPENENVSTAITPTESHSEPAVAVTHSSEMDNSDRSTWKTDELSILFNQVKQQC